MDKKEILLVKQKHVQKCSIKKERNEGREGR